MPIFIDLPPPHQKAEEYAEEQVKSARNGVTILLVALLIGTRSISILSRRWGSSGSLFCVGSFLSLIAMGLWYQGHTEAYGRPDAIDAHLTLTVLLAIALLDTVVALTSFFRGRRVPVADLGVGRLDRFLPRLPSAIAGTVSDIVFAVMLAATFHLCRSPIQGNWFLCVAVASLACSATSQLYKFRKRRQVRQALKRAAELSAHAIRSRSA